MSTLSPDNHTLHIVDAVSPPIRSSSAVIDVGTEEEARACFLAAARNNMLSTDFLSQMSARRVPTCERAHVAPKKNKSCQRCSQGKRKCDGNGIDPCSRCIGLGSRDQCIYIKRRVYKPRQRPDGSSDTLSQVVCHSQECSVATRPLHFGTHSLKRCRFSASPATGLIGMQENDLLSNFFACLGFFPLATKSNIREAMVKIMIDPTHGQPQGIRYDGLKEDEHARLDEHGLPHQRQVTCGDSEHPIMDPSFCTFWCCVALGALAQGRPLESVDGYFDMARNTIARCSKTPTPELARAWTLLGHLCAFRGDMDNYQLHMAYTRDFLREYPQGHPGKSPPVGLLELVKHAEAAKVFSGRADEGDIISLCQEEVNPPEINEVSTECEIYQYVILSYRNFDKVVWGKACESPVSTPRENVHDELDVEYAPTHHPPALTPTGRPTVDFGGVLGMMIAQLKHHSRHFEHFQQAADRAHLRSGIGGLIINCSLVFEKAAKGDTRGVLDRLGRTVEVYDRFPGISRFDMGLHIAHITLAALVAAGGPEAQALYNILQKIYNQMRSPEALPFPPIEEWHGLSRHCDSFYCMAMEQMIMNDEMTFSVTREGEETGTRDASTHGENYRRNDLSSEATESATPDASPDTSSTLGSHNQDGRPTPSEAGRRRDGALVPGTHQHTESMSENFDQKDSLLAPVPVFRGNKQSDNAPIGADVDALPERGRTQDYSNGGRAHHLSVFPRCSEHMSLSTGLVVPRCNEDPFLPVLDGRTAEEVLSAEDWLEATHAMLERR